MPSDEQAFLAAITAAPDDDTVRLVFADWLDERGSEDDRARAELIRVQCRAATLKPFSKERRELDRRAKAILNANGRRWTKPLYEIALGTWEFRRGFVEHVEVSARLFPKIGEKLFAAAPTVVSARFPDASNDVSDLDEPRDLVRSKALKQLRRVDLRDMCSCGGCTIQDELVALFRSKNAVNIRELNISGNRLGPDYARAMLTDSLLTKLTHLNLMNNPLGTEGVAAVAAAPELDALECLDLSGAVLTRKGLEALAAARRPNLKRLALRGNEIGVAGLKLLLESRLAKSLRELDLSHNRIGAAGAALLAEHAGFDSLDVLNLRHNDIGDTTALRARFGRRVKLSRS